MLGEGLILAAVSLLLCPSSVYSALEQVPDRCRKDLHVIIDFLIFSSLVTFEQLSCHSAFI